jgi:AcrR family transcriptional regulator
MKAPSASPRTRQKGKTDLTCRKILVSAKKIFARDGFRAAKLEEIVANAGYTRGAFYANFKSKEQLFIAVAEQQIRNLIETILQAVHSTHGIERKCQELLKAIQGNSEAQRWALLLTEFNLFILRQPRSKKRVAALYEDLLRGFGIVFEDLSKAARRKPSLPPSIIGLGFGALFQGLILQEMLNGKLVTPEVISDMLRLYIYGVLDKG